MKTNEEYLQELLSFLRSQSYIRPEEIPAIDLYMDQVTTFMEDHLNDTKRYKDDKVLTKTMINNYAKNNLLPPPVKKKYSRDHMLMLIFIYYFKSLLSFNDIEEIFGPITERHFDGKRTDLTLEMIYKEVFSLEEEGMERLMEDVKGKFDRAATTFLDAPVSKDDRDYLQLFSFICELSFDVYLKTQLIERLTDQLRMEKSDK